MIRMQGPGTPAAFHSRSSVVVPAGRSYDLQLCPPPPCDVGEGARCGNRQRRFEEWGNIEQGQLLGATSLLRGAGNPDSPRVVVRSGLGATDTDTAAELCAGGGPGGDLDAPSDHPEGHTLPQLHEAALRGEAPPPVASFRIQGRGLGLGRGVTGRGACLLLDSSWLGHGRVVPLAYPYSTVLPRPNDLAGINTKSKGHVEIDR